MIEMKPLDPAFPILQQLGEADTGPVVLLNVFTLDAADEHAFLAAWESDANYMKAQRGYISTQLHRAVGPSPAYFNQAVWESLEAFRAAFSDPGFRAKLSDYPSSAVTSPHLFRRVAASGPLRGVNRPDDMVDQSSIGTVSARCHCGAITISLMRPPAEVTQCNCSLCRSYGVLWAYFPAQDVAISPDPPATETYAWNGRHVDFHRCRNCGCVTHWTPRDPKRDRRGVNARLLPIEMLDAARLRHLDGAETGDYLD